MLERVNEAVIFIPDVHLDPEKPLHPSYRAVKNFLLSVQPSHVIIGGDFGDFNSISHHNKRRPLLQENKRYAEECALCIDELEDIKARAPHASRYYIKGNHENRDERWVEENPAMEGKIDVRRDLGVEALGYKWVSFNDVVTIGRMNYIHGWYWNKYHATTTLHRMGDNVMYGHAHFYDSRALKMRSRNQPYIAIGCGCLCDLNPPWKRNAPNDWINSFGYVEYRDDGFFQAHHIVVVNGSFSFGGYTWRA